MNVGQLIAKLQDLDPTLPVLIRAGENDYDYSTPKVEVTEMWQHPEAPDCYDTWDWKIPGEYESPFGSPPVSTTKVTAVVID